MPLQPPSQSFSAPFLASLPRPSSLPYPICSRAPVHVATTARIALAIISASLKVPDPEGHAAVVQDLGAIFHEYV